MKATAAHLHQRISPHLWDSIVSTLLIFVQTDCVNATVGQYELSSVNICLQIVRLFRNSPSSPTPGFQKCILGLEGCGGGGGGGKKSLVTSVGCLSAFFFQKDKAASSIVSVAMIRTFCY